MIVILTEDTAGGYDLLNLLRRKIFMTETAIYNTAYPDPDGCAGYSKFEQAINFLLADGKLRSGDALFLAYDNIIPTKPEMVNDRKSFEHKLARCERILKGNGITCFKSNYVCMEELLLSFAEIVEFCSAPDRDRNTSEIVKLKKLQSIISSHSQEIGYRMLFQPLIQRGYTIEKCLKGLLSKITLDRQFRAFRLTDTKIGVCWQHDCIESQAAFDERELAQCESCYAVHNLTVVDPDLSQTRLSYLYHHSLFQDALKPLSIEVTPVVEADNQ